MSYKVAAMVSIDVAATARSAHADHQGQDSLVVLSAFVMTSKSLSHGCGSVESASTVKSPGGWANLTVVKCRLMKDG